VFTPVLTLWAFLCQAISPDGTCRAAVARVLAWLVSQGQRPCSPQTGPYCKARARLPESLLRRLARETGRALHEQAPAGWLWRQRGVDFVVRLHQLRRADFRRGRRLGRRDHVVCWPKPPRPEWLDEAAYAALPSGLAVREVDVRVKQPGFRTRRPVVVTSLTDA